MELGGISIFQLLVLAIIGFYFWAIVHVLTSERSHGGAKFGWFVGVLLVPLITYPVFLIVTQKVIDQKRELALQVSRASG